MTTSVSIYDKKRRPGDIILLVLIYACAFLAVLLLVGIIAVSYTHLTDAASSNYH